MWPPLYRTKNEVHFTDSKMDPCFYAIPTAMKSLLQCDPCFHDSVLPTKHASMQSLFNGIPAQRRSLPPCDPCSMLSFIPQFPAIPCFYAVPSCFNAICYSMRLRYLLPCDPCCHAILLPCDQCFHMIPATVREIVSDVAHFLVQC